MVKMFYQYFFAVAIVGYCLNVFFPEITNRWLMAVVMTGFGLALILTGMFASSFARLIVSQWFDKRKISLGKLL